LQLSQEYIIRQGLAFDLAAGQLLFVDGFQYLAPASYRRLGETLALTQLQEHFGLFEFLFVLL
jgi:hypothetical protein